MAPLGLHVWLYLSSFSPLSLFSLSLSLWLPFLSIGFFLGVHYSLFLVLFCFLSSLHNRSLTIAADNLQPELAVKVYNAFKRGDVAVGISLL